MTARFSPLDQSDPREIAGYVLYARLGAGGMGSVYLSFTRGGHPVAVKVVRREFADHPEFRRRFRQEVAAARRVQGIYTAAVLDFDPDAPVPWLVTEYIAGPSLAEAVTENGPLPLFSLCRLLGGVAEGLSSVHGAGLVHRDLKPANVLLAEDGPRVIDFGIAHAADVTTQTGPGAFVGTPAFMTPEQVNGEPVSPATDVFALGHLVAYAGTGHTVFGDGHPAALVQRIAARAPNLDGCPAELRPFLERCLEKEPTDRPEVGEAVEFARELIAGETGRLVGASWLPEQIATTLSAYDSAVAVRTATIPSAPASPPVTSPPPAGTPAPGQHPSFPSAPAGVPAWSPQPTGQGQPGVPSPPQGPQPGYGGMPPGTGLPPGPAGRPWVQPARPPGGRRSLLRPAVLVPTGIAAVIIIAIVATSHLGGSSTPQAGPSGAGSSTGPAPSADTSGKTGTVAPSNSYAVKYSDYSFKMPGGGCNDGFPSAVNFNGTGPVVSAPPGGVDNNGENDIELACGIPNEIDFDGAQAVAEVSGSPGPSGCVQAITTAPEQGSILFSDLSLGEQFCIKAASGLLVRVTLTGLNDTSYDLAWTATAWQPPSTGLPGQE